MAVQEHHFNHFKNQSNPPFFQNSPAVYSHTRLFQPCLQGPEQLHSKGAELAPKIVLYFTHRNGPILGAKTDLFDLQCNVVRVAWCSQIDSFHFKNPRCYNLKSLIFKPSLLFIHAFKNAIQLLNTFFLQANRSQMLYLLL